MQREPLTDDEMRALRLEVVRRLEAMAAGDCPQCGAHVEREEQVGRCVYGVPCGCRMFVGRAKTQPRLS